MATNNKKENDMKQVLVYFTNYYSYGYSAYTIIAGTVMVVNKNSDDQYFLITDGGECVTGNVQELINL